MDTRFLNYLLLLMLLLLLIIYLLQSTYYVNNNYNNNYNNSYNNNHNNNHNKMMQNVIIRDPRNENDFLLTNHITNTPYHIRGPVRCFHQQFNIKRNNCVNLL